MKQMRGFLAVLFASSALVLVGCGSVAPAAPQVEAPEVAQGSASPEVMVEAEVPTSQEEEPAASSVADLFTAPITAVGESLIVTGQILDVNGAPLAGAAIEFWQTDLSGVYDHPGDPGTNSRDLGFQFYGTSIADSDGQYAFRTILPGQYEPRPRHIHVKIKSDGRELLTTQFYFAEDGASGGIGGSTENLLLTLEPASMSDGTPGWWASFDVVVNTGIGAGSLRLTDSQGEGPFYPVVNVADYDNDLANVGG